MPYRECFDAVPVLRVGPCAARRADRAVAAGAADLLRQHAGSVDNLARGLTRLGHDVRFSRWASRAVQSLIAVLPQLMGTSVEEAAYLPGCPRAADADAGPR
jgi:hypothetical protein